eukprot:CAMPEP_0198252746 /NCGR_PEP_ID=MMETSP1447-20131203/3226_1 /TAXON_ID=420782 /ORGANISM="Chaetoceros dichaeta, Strain CCMP1751" /LENGTH=178 /DNA_ID=CAMNT_0043938119 /DNA_START=42 /DNA_END=574 /DNA_ORIENTATION=-
MKTTTTKTDTTLKPLNETLKALNKIKTSLFPFLHILDRHHNNNNPTTRRPYGNDDDDDDYDVHQIAEAHAAVALSIGTLRYMANRLQGRRNTTADDDDDDDDDEEDAGDESKTKQDPLRMELDKMRRTLVEVKKLQRGMGSSMDDIGKKRKDTVEKSGGTRQTQNSGEKKRKLVRGSV